MIAGYLKKIFIKRMVKQNLKNVKNKLSKTEVAEINLMLKHIKNSASIYRPSKYWIELNLANVNQLFHHGYENFKKTIALNYFTFVRITPLDPQIIFLIKNTSSINLKNLMLQAIRGEKHNFFSQFNYIQSILYNFLTYASYQYACSLIRDARYLNLMEPSLGGPPKILDDSGKLISQDLSNSLLEVYSIEKATKNFFFKSGGLSVLELGAGYGRNAYVINSLMKIKKYIIVDIPPALWVSQKYLSVLFPNLKVFKYQEIKDYKAVETEFNSSNLIFITPTQLEKLKPSSVDLIVTISSLHEMRLDQIKNYFKHFDRLLKIKGYFYFKQWYTAKVLFEDIVILKKDYPIPKNWDVIFDRPAKIHPKLFEGLYKKIE